MSANASSIRAYIVSEFLDPADADELRDDTPLLSSGVIDSLGLVRLVSFLETTFGVRLKAHQMNREHLDTIADMVRVVDAAKQE